LSTKNIEKLGGNLFKPEKNKIESIFKGKSHIINTKHTGLELAIESKVT
jgi:hypothetical protein